MYVLIVDVYLYVRSDAESVRSPRPAPRGSRPGFYMFLLVLLLSLLELSLVVVVVVVAEVVAVVLLCLFLVVK